MDLQHLLLGGEIDPDHMPAPVVRRARRLTAITRHATAHGSGVTVHVPVPCHKRPGRRPCGGFLLVHCQDAPPQIRWECPVCRNGGAIFGWTDSTFDLRGLHQEYEGREVIDLELPPDLHPVLPRLAECSPEWGRAVALSFVADERIVVSVPVELRGHAASQALEAAFSGEGPTTAERLVQIAMALTEDALAEPAALDSDAGDPGAMAELLATVDDLVDRVAPPPRPAPRPRSRRRSKQDPRTFVLRVSLRYVKPQVWRRIEVPADIELPELHDVLQVAMGWTDSHLHAFRAGRRVYSPRDSEWDSIGEDTEGVRLSDLAGQKGARFVYEYDFGDGWEHDVVVEAVRDEECTKLRCVAGKHACPPEDCGGAPGYARLLTALSDPADEEHETLVEWVGGSFDPAAFDLAATDAQLGHVGDG